MYNKKELKKEEEEGGINQFARVQKTSALQEARAFNETPVNPRKCALILTKILYLLNHGETLSTQEATDCFFNLTKLFQCKDTNLRRLVYIGIKNLSTIAENVYVVTSSLTQDMNSKDDLCRPSAMRALITITDGTTLQGIERYMKQAIVESKNPSLASAALVSSLHMSKNLPEAIKRYVNEAQEAVNSENPMVQTHALGLLYHLRKNDRLGVSKMVSKYIKSGSLKSPFAICFLIRIVSKIIQDETESDGDGNQDSSGMINSPEFEFIESCLRHKSEMVVYEAANSIVNLKCSTAREISPAISVLQLFLSSPKPILRFAAVRTLNKVAINSPLAVVSCNVDLENLITDSNRSIATLAITTLLKTGSESSVERLMKQISSFMSEISDEFKIVVIAATRQLVSKFSKKSNIMMTFLSGMLREEGGYEYKKSIVDTIINIIYDNADCKESGLSHLCEFIEDCEHTQLAVRILYLLGKEGPKTARPSKFIRYIYNRLILENSQTRVAAVSALGKFGTATSDESMIHNICVLLERSTLDSDDEVRDRSVYYLNILRTREKNIYHHCINSNLQVSLIGLEKALQQYLDISNKSSETSFETPFDMKSVPLSSLPLIGSSDRESSSSSYQSRSNLNGRSPSISNSDGSKNGAKKDSSKGTIATRQDVYWEQLQSISEIKDNDLGPLLNSSMPIELTESETEYVVQCIKHVFKKHVVLQFDLTNTCNDQILADVNVHFTVPENYREVARVACPKLIYNVPGTCYSILEILLDEHEDDLSPLVVTFSDVLMKYVVRDCDPNTGELEDDVGYNDEYALEDIDLMVSDFMSKVNKSNFLSSWDDLDPNLEVEETYSLSNFKTIDQAVKNIIGFMGMSPCDRSDRLKSADNKSIHSHTLYLAGLFRSQVEVLVCAKLAIPSSNPDSGVILKLCVRSKDITVSNFVASAVV